LGTEVEGSRCVHDLHPRSSLRALSLTPLGFARVQLSPQETNLLVTEPVFNLPNVQEHYDQMIFEDYDFASYLRCPGALILALL